MKVTVIAATRLIPQPEYLEGPPYETEKWLPDAGGSGSQELSEFAGRACYESWNRPNPATATNAGYIDHILEVNHESVLEHGAVTFYITDVSRTLTHELVRHRHLSFSQRSQRYVPEDTYHFIVPEALQAIAGERLPNDQSVQEAVTELHRRSQELYSHIKDILKNKGVPIKVARGAARSVTLANAETRIVVSGNHRAWRDFLKKRWHVAADPEIMKLAGMILRILKQMEPSIYQDFDSLDPVGTPAF